MTEQYISLSPIKFIRYHPQHFNKVESLTPPFPPGGSARHATRSMRLSIYILSNCRKYLLGMKYSSLLFNRVDLPAGKSHHEPTMFLVG